MELARKLPTQANELTLENIQNVSAKQLSEYGQEFISEIQYFINFTQIVKEEFYFEEKLDSEKKQNKKY